MGYDLYQAVFVRGGMYIISVWHALGKQQEPTWTVMRHDEYLLHIYCSFLSCFLVVFFLMASILRLLEYVRGCKRLIFVAPSIRNRSPCSYKWFLHTSDVPCLLGQFFTLTLESLSLSLSSSPLRATLPHLSSSQLLNPWWCFSSSGQQDLLSFPLPLDSTTLFFCPCPDHPTAWAVPPQLGKYLILKRHSSFCWGVF